MDDRLREINQHIYRIDGEVEELTEVVSGMFEQYDQSYSEFRGMRLEQESPQTYSTTPTSAPADPFGLFGNPGDVSSTSRQHGSDIDDE
ncbi:hypothetical protein Tco_1097621 [Tanacetum coccineum]